MKQVSFLFRRTPICAFFFLCLLPFFVMADDSRQYEGIATPRLNNCILEEQARHHHHHHHSSKCEENTLNIDSVVGIAQSFTIPPPPSFNVTVTPFVTLPNGNTIFGDPQSIVSVFGGPSRLNSIPNVPAISGAYDIGIKVTSDSTDLSILTFRLSNLITDLQTGNSTAVGGSNNQIKLLLLAPVLQAQFINDFVYSP